MESTEDIRARVKDLIAECMFLSSSTEIGDEDNLQEAHGVESMNIFELVVAIEDTWGISLQHGDFSADKFSTVASIAQFIEACIDP